MKLEIFFFQLVVCNCTSLPTGNCFACFLCLHRKFINVATVPLGVVLKYFPCAAGLSKTINYVMNTRNRPLHFPKSKTQYCVQYIYRIKQILVSDSCHTTSRLQKGHGRKLGWNTRYNRADRFFHTFYEPSMGSSRQQRPCDRGGHPYKFCAAARLTRLDVQKFYDNIIEGTKNM